MTHGERLAYEHIFDWEREHPERIYLTQPLPGGEVLDLTWGQTMDQARRIAAYLQGLDLPPGSSIAIFSKNSAWWVIADLAITLAGHVSVPLYPNLAADTVRYVLEHSDSRLIVVGKLDGWEEMKAGIPEGLPMIATPLAPEGVSPTWDSIVAETEPLTGNPQRDPEETATILYTSGSTGRPKGVVIAFAAQTAAARSWGGRDRHPGR